MASSSCSLRFPAVGGGLNGILNQAVAASRLLLPSTTSVRVSWNGHQGGGEGRRGILVVRSCDSVAGAVVPPAAPLPSDQSEYFDSKSFRKTLTRSDNYNRSGFGYKKEMLHQMEEEYTSDMMQTLKEDNFEHTWGNVTVKLGFVGELSELFKLLMRLANSSRNTTCGSPMKSFTIPQ
ncbi:unnamed protein product [Sphagnum compactum]